MPVGHAYTAADEGGDSWIVRYYDKRAAMFAVESVEQMHYLQFA
jgi:hypothetical protein